MKQQFSWRAILALSLLAAPVFAQVPQDVTFTGRLVDDLGDPLGGPVNLELRIFDAETMGTQLYSEQHLVVPLDATGGFSVQLGLGTSPSGTFDAALFSEVNRWLEVVVGAEVMTPRQMLGSVPWALVAERANEVLRDPNASRFEDCGDGTVADYQTGLQWEKKTGTVQSGTECAVFDCPDPHDVDNIYKWSDTGTAPDGGAFTDFLAKLNDQTFGTAATASDVTGCFAGHCDWRLPSIVELETILDCANPGCIDPVFGPTARNFTWSASTDEDPARAWYAYFNLSGNLNSNIKLANYKVRAVRAGSCR